ncbi:unnamed protein product [Diamesa hyperborea]
MVRVAKKQKETVQEAISSPVETVTQTRTRRTPKPNPKYVNESTIAAPPKATSTSSESNTPVVSENEEQPIPIKIAPKSVKKVFNKKESPLAKVINNQVAAAARSLRKTAPSTPIPMRAKIVAKKQKLEYDDEATDQADEQEEDAKSDPSSTAPPRVTRSGRVESTIGSKVDTPTTKPTSVNTKSDDKQFVTLVSIHDIIKKNDPPKITKLDRKRVNDSPNQSPGEESSAKKAKEEKPSLITARKSYMPQKKEEELEKEIEEEAEAEEEEEEEQMEEEEDDIEEAIPAQEVKTTRARKVALQQTPIVAKAKPTAVVVAKTPTESPTTEGRRLITKRGTPTIVASPPSVMNLTPSPIKTINNGKLNNNSATKPSPRILNSTVTPKAKQTQNVTLLNSDTANNKLFSIDLTEEANSQKEASPTATAVKENSSNVINKTQPAQILKRQLETELNRMRASHKLFAHNQQQRQPARNRVSLPIVAPQPRRVTKFESWYIIDVPKEEIVPQKHNHTFSLIKLGNNVKVMKLPSSEWEYKLTLQKRTMPLKKNVNNNQDDSIEEDDNNDKSAGEKQNYEPSNIMFKRTNRTPTRVSIDRSMIINGNSYVISIDGKNCKLIGAPEDIKSVADVETLLNILDAVDLKNSCVELAASENVITIL